MKLQTQKTATLIEDQLNGFFLNLENRNIAVKISQVINLNLHQLIERKESEKAFLGDGYIENLDKKRLTGQLKRVYDILATGGWWTLAELSWRAKAPESSVSACLRALRRKIYGAHVIVKRRRIPSGGQFEYKIIGGCNV